MRASLSAYSNGAAPSPAGGCGKQARSITASRCRVREHRHTQWPSLLGFWGVPNLRVINRDVHLTKCAEEARSRRDSAGRTADP